MTVMTPAPPTPAWLFASLKDPHTRNQLRQALHEAVHERRGPMLDLLQDVLADSGITLIEPGTVTIAADARADVTQQQRQPFAV